MNQEISIREIIFILMKGKWIIVTITAIAVIVTILYNMFIANPIYESSSNVRIANSTQEQGQVLDVNTFVESIQSDAAMNRIIERLELNPDIYSIPIIRNLIKIEVKKNTNVLKINVKSSDSALNTTISNMLAYELANRIEISDRSQNVVEDQNKLRELSDSIVSTNSELSEAEKQLAKIPEKQTITQIISESALLMSIIKESSKLDSTEIAGLKMQSESLNPAYNQLQARVAEISINLTKLKTEVENIQKRIKESSSRIEELDNEMIHNKLNLKNSDRLLKGYQAVFISPAIQPDDPVGPNKILNMIIAFCIGILISVIYVIFRNYWNNNIK